MFSLRAKWYTKNSSVMTECVNYFLESLLKRATIDFVKVSETSKYVSVQKI